jgi:hypothetical protein
MDAILPYPARADALAPGGLREGAVDAPAPQGLVRCLRCQHAVVAGALATYGKIGALRWRGFHEHVEPLGHDRRDRMDARRAICPHGRQVRGRGSQLALQPTWPAGNRVDDVSACRHRSDSTKRSIRRRLVSSAFARSTSLTCLRRSPKGSRPKAARLAGSASSASRCQRETEVRGVLHVRHRPGTLLPQPRPG